MYNQYREGWLEVICGCMFAGKTEELIRRINVLSYAKKNIMVFKPKIDNRYSDEEIVSHAGTHIPCIVVDKGQDILKHIHDDIEVVAIDEIQFFDKDIIDVCEYLADITPIFVRRQSAYIVRRPIRCDGLPPPNLGNYIGKSKHFLSSGKDLLTNFMRIGKRLERPAELWYRFVAGLLPKIEKFRRNSKFRRKNRTSDNQITSLIPNYISIQNNRV